MVDLLDLNVLTALASGPALALLAVPLLLVRPRRAHVVSIATFLLLWGGLITLGNLSRLVYADGHAWLAERLILAFLAVETVLYIPLVYFAAVYPVRHGIVATRPWASVLLVVPALVATALLAHDLSLFHRGFEGGASLGSNWGPLFPYFMLLFGAAMFWTLYSLARHAATTTHENARKRTLLVLVALALYTGFWVGELATVAAYFLVQGINPAANAVYLVTGLAGIAVLIGICATSMGCRTPREGNRMHLAILVPLAGGLVSGATQLHPDVVTIETVGLWRIGACILLAFALLRYEDSPLAHKSLRAYLVFSGLLFTLFVVVYTEQLLERMTGSSGIAVAITQALLIAALFGLLLSEPGALRWLRLRLDRVPVPDPEGKRLDIYEAALTHALADGDTHDQGHLALLRERLMISVAEHEALTRVVSAHRARTARPIGPGALLGGRYRLGARLGDGTHATAYEAEDTVLGRRVVAKVLDGPTRVDLAAFQDEARLAASVEHANVLRVYDSGVHGTTPFLVTEQADGGSLHALVEERGALPEDEALEILDGLLGGLQHLHDRGIVHGDLSESNILIGRDRQVRIADFGLAVAMDTDTTQTGLGVPRLAGTPATMSPEQVDGRAWTKRSDIYAAGAIAYRLLSGRPYIDLEAKDVFGLRRAILNEKPAPLPAHVPEHIRDAVLAALAKRPEDRPASAAALRDRLSP